jgi:hypothetical protein
MPDAQAVRTPAMKGIGVTIIGGDPVFPSGFG